MASDSASWIPCRNGLATTELCADRCQPTATKSQTSHGTAGNRKHEAALLFHFAFHAFRLFASFDGIGISRFLYALGVQPLSGLWLTRTVYATRWRSDQYVYITSCSRIPVIKKTHTKAALPRHTSQSCEPAPCRNLIDSVASRDLAPFLGHTLLLLGAANKGIALGLSVGITGLQVLDK
jgi:hypothetical protein